MTTINTAMRELDRFDEETQRNILLQFLKDKGLITDFIAFLDREYGRDDEDDYSDDTAWLDYRQ